MAKVLETSLRANAHNAKGSVVLITGGAKGLGKEVALEFAKAG